MRPISRRVLPVLSVTVALLLAGCVPKDSRDLHEVEPVRDRPVPVFPDVGNVAPELVVQGLTHDFTERPVDQDYWAPSDDEATCAANEIVDEVGSDRLVGLGYRPGRRGASLNDVSLTDAERRKVVDAFEACVDMVQGLAAMFYGPGRMPTRVASCLAEGMGESGMLDTIVAAWAGGTAVDPFADDSAFGTALLGHAEVCIPAGAFDWPDLRLPDDDPILDSDAPAGSGRSSHVDDVGNPDAPDDTAPRATDVPPATQGP